MYKERAICIFIDMTQASPPKECDTCRRSKKIQIKERQARLKDQTDSITIGSCKLRKYVAQGRRCECFLLRKDYSESVVGKDSINQWMQRPGISAMHICRHCRLYRTWSDVNFLLWMACICPQFCHNEWRSRFWIVDPYKKTGQVLIVEYVW